MLVQTIVDGDMLEREANLLDQMDAILGLHRRVRVSPSQPSVSAGCNALQHKDRGSHCRIDKHRGNSVTDAITAESGMPSLPRQLRANISDPHFGGAISRLEAG